MPSTRLVVGAGHDAHETVLGCHGHRAAIGGERELAELDIVALRARFGRRQSSADDLRIGEADGGDAAFIPRSLARRR
jgi:hypothetical protein